MTILERPDALSEPWRCVYCGSTNVAITADNRRRCGPLHHVQPDIHRHRHSDSFTPSGELRCVVCLCVLEYAENDYVPDDGFPTSISPFVRFLQAMADVEPTQTWARTGRSFFAHWRVGPATCRARVREDRRGPGGWWFEWSIWNRGDFLAGGGSSTRSTKRVAQATAEREVHDVLVELVSLPS